MGRQSGVESTGDFLCAGDTLGRLSLGRRDAGASLAAYLGHLQPHALGCEPQLEGCGPASC